MSFMHEGGVRGGRRALSGPFVAPAPAALGLAAPGAVTTARLQAAPAACWLAGSRSRDMRDAAVLMDQPVRACQLSRLFRGHRKPAALARPLWEMREMRARSGYTAIQVVAHLRDFFGVCMLGEGGRADCAGKLLLSWLNDNSHAEVEHLPWGMGLARAMAAWCDLLELQAELAALAHSTSPDKATRIATAMASVRCGDFDGGREHFLGLLRRDRGGAGGGQTEGPGTGRGAERGHGGDSCGVVSDGVQSDSKGATEAGCGGRHPAGGHGGAGALVGVGAQ